MRGEIERETEAEEAIERPDDVQVVRADRDHQPDRCSKRPQPGLRCERGGEADRFGQQPANRGAGPGDAQRPFALAGADAVPTMAASGAPRPKTSGTSRYSSRAPVP